MSFLENVNNWAKNEPNFYINIAVDHFTNTDSKILNVSGLKLKTLPEIFDHHKQVNDLDLGENQLTILPDSIKNLTSLVSINLSYNFFSNIPDQIFGFSALKELHLSNLGIQELPAQIGILTSLQILDLSENSLKKLPPEIGSLTNLQRLHLYNNLLTELPNTMINLTNLWDLNLGQNKINQLPDFITGLVQGNLQKLVVSCPLNAPVKVLLKGWEIYREAIVKYGGSDDTNKPIRDNRNLLRNIVPRGFGSLTLPSMYEKRYNYGVIDFSYLRNSPLVYKFLENPLLQSKIEELTLSQELLKISPEGTQIPEGLLKFKNLKKLHLIEPSAEKIEPSEENIEIFDDTLGDY